MGELAGEKAVFGGEQKKRAYVLVGAHYGGEMYFVQQVEKKLWISDGRGEGAFCC